LLDAENKTRNFDAGLPHFKPNVDFSKHIANRD